VPTITTIDGVKITMYPDDQAPPHFHVLTPDGEAQIRIDNLAVIRGRLRRSDLAKVIEWASGKNRVALMNEWNRLNERE